MKILFYLSLTFTLLFSTTINKNVTYNISYGIFGNMGTTHASIKVDKNNNYKITVKAYTNGISKIISNNLQEVYTSEGKYEDLKFKPSKFTKLTSTNDQEKYYEYTFNHIKKYVTLERTKKFKKYDFDFETYMNNESKFTWKTTSYKKKLNYYAKEDILSLFFNIKSYLKDFEQGQVEHIRAIGSSDKRKGKIDLIIPKGKKYEELSNTLKSKRDIVIVKIYTKIFSSNDGELYISLNEEGIAKKAILKDVLFFGDVEANLQ